MVAQKLVKLRHAGIVCITAGRHPLTLPSLKLLLALMKARGSCFKSACTKGWAFRKLRSSLLSFRKSLLLARVGSLRSFSAIQGRLERNCSKERNSSRVLSFSYCHCHGPWATPFAPSPRVARNINNADRAECGIRLTVFLLFLYYIPCLSRQICCHTRNVLRPAGQVSLNQHVAACTSAAKGLLF